MGRIHLDDVKSDVAMHAELISFDQNTSWGETAHHGPW